MRSNALSRCARVLISTMLLTGCAEAPTTTGAIRVTAVKGDAGNPAQGVTVELVGQPAAAITSTSGKAFLANLAPGSYVVRVTLIGYCESKRDAVVTAGTVTEVLIWLCADVVAPVNPIADEFLGLLDLRAETATGSECENDRLVVGAHRIASLGVNALPLGGCRGAAWILAPDQAPAFGDDPAQFSWTAAFGDTYAPALPSQRLRVAVTIWISDKTMDAAARLDLRHKLTDALLPKANDLFRDNLSGILLVADETGTALPEILDVADVVDPVTGTHPFDKVGSDCTNVPSIQATPSVYHADRINVYYMKEILGGSAKGYNCVAQGAPNVIFMDADGSDYFTLPHELGHGLGLTLPDWGHSEQVPGFWGDATGALSIMGRYATAPTYFSVGQVVRMHVEPRSWLNIPVGGTSVRSRQSTTATTPLMTPCGCPESASTDHCPTLRTDIVRAGTQYGTAPFIMACHVKAPACASVQPGHMISVDGAFFSSEAETAPGFGEALVVSLAPHLATAVLQDEAPGRATAKITGVSPGRAEVRIYGGGAYATLEVRVGEACP